MLEMPNDPRSSVVKTSDWVITYLIASIPLVGFIMLFVWAFGSDTNYNKANWAKAALIWAVISLALVMFFFMAFGAAILAALSQSGQY